MSISLMSAIFETEFRDLPTGEGDQMAKASSLKIVMLAIADHANDEGESAYPGMKKLVRKTGLSKQGLINVLTACKYNGLLYVSAEPSRLGTNNYTIELSCYPILQGKDEDRLVVKSLDQSSHLTTSGKATLPPLVKPLDHNHPLTTIKPSLSERKEKAKERIEDQRAKRKDPVDWVLGNAEKEGAITSMQERTSKALGLDVSGSRFDKMVSFLMQKDRQGETIEVYAAWMKADPYNSPKTHQIAQRPDIVRETWAAAFVNKEPSFDEALEKAGYK